MITIGGHQNQVEKGWVHKSEVSRAVCWHCSVLFPAQGQVTKGSWKPEQNTVFSPIHWRSFGFGDKIWIGPSVPFSWSVNLPKSSKVHQALGWIMIHDDIMSSLKLRLLRLTSGESEIRWQSFYLSVNQVLLDILCRSALEDVWKSKGSPPWCAVSCWGLSYSGLRTWADILGYFLIDILQLGVGSYHGTFGNLLPYFSSYMRQVTWSSCHYILTISVVHRFFIEISTPRWQRPSPSIFCGRSCPGGHLPTQWTHSYSHLGQVECLWWKMWYWISIFSRGCLLFGCLMFTLGPILTYFTINTNTALVSLTYGVEWYL